MEVMRVGVRLSPTTGRWLSNTPMGFGLQRVGDTATTRTAGLRRACAQRTLEVSKTPARSVPARLWAVSRGLSPTAERWLRNTAMALGCGALWDTACSEAEGATRTAGSC